MGTHDDIQSGGSMSSDPISGAKGIAELRLSREVAVSKSSLSAASRSNGYDIGTKGKHSHRDYSASSSHHNTSEDAAYSLKENNVALIAQPLFETDDRSQHRLNPRLGKRPRRKILGVECSRIRRGSLTSSEAFANEVCRAATRPKSWRNLTTIPGPTALLTGKENMTMNACAAIAVKATSMEHISTMRTGYASRDLSSGTACSQGAARVTRLRRSDSKSSTSHQSSKPYFTVGNRFHSPPNSHVSLSPHLQQLNLTSCDGTANTHDLVEDALQRAEEYEVTWLQTQASSIHQVINQIFRTGSRAADQSIDYETITGDLLLRFIENGQHSSLHSRLESSLSYGVLKPPKKASEFLSRLSCDLAVRERFMTFWIDTYDFTFLMAVTSMIAGRFAPAHSNGVSSEQFRDCPQQHIVTMSQPNLRQKVKSQLRSFFPESLGTRCRERCISPMLGWRRTMLRALLLIHALDMAKYGAQSQRPLFQPQGKFQSSQQAVQHLGTLLCPWVGSLIEVLRRLDYRVQYGDSGLLDYDFHVTNVVTDFRNGIKLLYLVETLCETNDQYRSNTFRDEGCGERGKVNGIALLTRLNVACNTREQRLSNVEVTFKVLDTIPGMHQLISDISPRDVVDGHQERSLKLLWIILAFAGMIVIDVCEIRRETRRLRRLSRARQSSGERWQSSEASNGSESMSQKSILTAWAAEIKPPEIKGIGSKKVFESIIDEYRQYVPTSVQRLEEQGSTAKLREIGCSRAFASIIESGDAFDENTTLVVLRYLASRLLPASRKGRAASTIWRAYCQHGASRTRRDVPLRKQTVLGNRQSMRRESSGDDIWVL